MNYNLKKFKNGLQQLHIALSEKQMEQFLQYYELLVEKNKVMNLTAITEFDEVEEKRFLDSVSLTKQVQEQVFLVFHLRLFFLNLRLL